MPIKTFEQLSQLNNKPRQLRMSKEQRAEIEKAIAANISTSAIAEFFEITPSRVSQIKKQMEKRNAGN